MHIYIYIKCTLAFYFSTNLKTINIFSWPLYISFVVTLDEQYDIVNCI